MTHDHLILLDAVGSPVLWATLAAMFVTGLVGGVSHCAGMCGPFVLSQVGARLDRVELTRFGWPQRTRTAALLPYHLGRLTSYAGLGAIAGGIGDVASTLTRSSWLPALFLVLAATMLLARAAGRPLFATGGGTAWSVGNAFSVTLGPLLRDPAGPRAYLLGVALGFLPCGLLYAALTAAAGCGSPALGASAMASFALGTFPALFVVGYGGAVLGAGRRRIVERLSAPLMVASAIVLIALATRMVL